MMKVGAASDRLDSNDVDFEVKSKELHEELLQRAKNHGYTDMVTAKAFIDGWYSKHNGYSIDHERTFIESFRSILQRCSHQHTEETS